eukprot:COSAG05_NODE_1036_length_6076_cov_159.776476_1_plen_209_part_00
MLDQIRTCTSSPGLGSRWLSPSSYLKAAEPGSTGYRSGGNSAAVTAVTANDNVGGRRGSITSRSRGFCVSFFLGSDGSEFEPEYKWLMSFDTAFFAYDVFVTTVDGGVAVTSKEPDRARLSWARLDQWRTHDMLTCSSLPVLDRLVKFENEHPYSQPRHEAQKAVVDHTKFCLTTCGAAVVRIEEPRRIRVRIPKRLAAFCLISEIEL